MQPIPQWHTVDVFCHPGMILGVVLDMSGRLTLSIRNDKQEWSADLTPQLKSVQVLQPGNTCFTITATQPQSQKVEHDATAANHLQV